MTQTIISFPTDTSAAAHCTELPTDGCKSVCGDSGVHTYANVRVHPESVCVCACTIFNCVTAII